jgi:hypothetical protein
MKFVTRLLSLVTLAALAASAATDENLAWTLPIGTCIEGDRLVAEIAADATDRRDVRARAEIDCGEALAAMQGVAVTVRVRASGVTEPDHPWNGVKVQLRYTDKEGNPHYPAFELPRGSFGWTNATVRLSALAHPNGIGNGGRATILLGLEGCAGRAEFDLASLRIETEDSGIPRAIGANEGAPQGGAMKGAAAQQMKGAPAAQMDDNSSFGGYADTLHSREAGPSLHAAAQRRTPLRGCMLPVRATTEDDITVLAGWGATLVRFQITRDFGKIGANSDLAEYAAWVDSRLDNLAQVLKWCAARDMKVCVDLHAPPGGIRAGDRATAMLYDERLADAFVETWRRIATRFKGHSALYGYDLVNEPKQLAFAPVNYWEIQRRAAKAIRKIDPDTAIIVESNISASPSAFSYLAPLAMDNMIYQLHMYAPSEYTHQGVGTHPLMKDGQPLVWPDPARGWDRDWLRRVLEPVREFQEKHQCRIYVGEFSAIAWAQGAENYLRDCIALFEEYGWDWTYHAFREWSAWSIEHEVAAPGKPPVPSAGNPRKRALLEGLGGEASSRAIAPARQGTTTAD